MSRNLFSGMLLLVLSACSTSAAEEQAAAAKAAAGNRTYVPAERSLESGTRIGATINGAVSSKVNKAGESFWATVSGDVKDDNGHIVIPAGSAVKLMIGQLEPAGNTSQKDGKLSFSVSSVSVRSVVYPVSADLDPVQHHLEARKVTAGQVATVGVGAAAGAVAGQIIGKNTTGAVIGGVVGAGAGTVVAVKSANRDVVVNSGTPILFSLTRQLSISTK